MLATAIRALSNICFPAGDRSDHTLTGLTFDSRVVSPNSLFVALVAENRDGHEFVLNAVQNGASALLVEKELDCLQQLNEDIWVIQVPDTYQALLEIGSWYRKNVLTAPVVAITGSYAKTTVKAFTSAVLAELGSGTVTQGNFNNLIGVPVTLASATVENRFGLIELGMNHYGEIETLSKVVDPDFGLITHIGRAHLEYFGSEWGVAQAKGELFANMRPAATRLINLDDPFIYDLAKIHPGTNDIGYTLKGKKADWLNTIIEGHIVPADQQGHYGVKVHGTSIRSPLPGQHQCENILAAVVIGLAFNLPIKSIAERIESNHDIPMRGQVVTVGTVRIIRDEYNASFHSVVAALDMLCDLPNSRKKIAVLGDIFELGSHSRIDHEMIATEIIHRKIDEVYLIGSAMHFAYTRLKDEGYVKVSHYEDVEELVADLLPRIHDNDVVLVKASRGMALERVSKAVITEIERRIAA